jgi:hypothetical protein
MALPHAADGLRTRGKERIRHAGMDYHDLLGRKAEDTNRIIPSAFRNGDDLGGPLTDFSQAAFGQEVARGMQLRQQARGHVVDGGGEPWFSRRMLQQTAPVKNIRTADQPIGHRQGGSVGQGERAQAGPRAPKASHRPLMIQRAQGFHRWESADDPTAGGAPQNAESNNRDRFSHRRCGPAAESRRSPRAWFLVCYIWYTRSL